MDALGAMLGQGLTISEADGAGQPCNTRSAKHEGSAETAAQRCVVKHCVTKKRLVSSVCLT